MLKWSESGALGRAWQRATETVGSAADVSFLTALFGLLTVGGVYVLVRATRGLWAAWGMERRDWDFTRNEWVGLAGASSVMLIVVGCMFWLYA